MTLPADLGETVTLDLDDLLFVDPPLRHARRGPRLRQRPLEDPVITDGLVIVLCLVGLGIIALLYLTRKDQS